MTTKNQLSKLDQNSLRSFLRQHTGHILTVERKNNCGLVSTAYARLSDEYLTAGNDSIPLSAVAAVRCCGFSSWKPAAQE